MTEKVKEEFDDILDSLCDYQFDARHYTCERISQLVEDKVLGDKLKRDADKEFHLTMNIIGFVRDNADQFVEYCKKQQEIITKAKNTK